jgi:hypothetical protein
MKAMTGKQAATIIEAMLPVEVLGKLHQNNNDALNRQPMEPCPELDVLEVLAIDMIFTKTPNGTIVPNCDPAKLISRVPKRLVDSSTTYGAKVIASALYLQLNRIWPDCIEEIICAICDAVMVSIVNKVKQHGGNDPWLYRTN